MKKLSALALPIAGIIFVLFWMQLKDVESEPVLTEAYEVLYVKDGDTIVVKMDDKDVTIRLIGVDAPESVHPNESKNTEEGKEASAWMKNLLTGKAVYLEYDIERYDDYERTLAYVYIKTDEEYRMVNEMLLEADMAEPLSIRPNTKYKRKLQLAYER